MYWISSILAALLIGSPLGSAVADTVWWNSSAGRVVEHHGHHIARCSLILHQDHNRVVFEWHNGNLTVTAANPDWHFAKPQTVQASLRIGDQFISDSAKSAILDAVAERDSITFVVIDAIEPMLLKGDHVSVEFKGGRLDVPINRDKMAEVLIHTHKCRDAADRTDPRDLNAASGSADTD